MFSAREATSTSIEQQCPMLRGNDHYCSFATNGICCLSAKAVAVTPRDRASTALSRAHIFSRSRRSHNYIYETTYKIDNTPYQLFSADIKSRL